MSITGAMNVARRCAGRLRRYGTRHLVRTAPYGLRLSQTTPSYLFPAHESANYVNGTVRLFSDNPAVYRLAEEGIETALVRFRLSNVCVSHIRFRTKNKLTKLSSTQRKYGLLHLASQKVDGVAHGSTGHTYSHSTGSRPTS